MKGRSAGLALLVIVTLASPALAGGGPDSDDVRQTAEPVVFKVHDAAEDTYGSATGEQAPKGGAEDTWGDVWDSMPSNLGNPADNLPDDGGDPPEDPERIPLPAGGPTNGIGQLLGLIEDAEQTTEETTTHGVGFLHGLLMAGGEVVIATFTLIERTTGPTVEQAVTRAVSTYDDVRSFLVEIAADDGAQSGKGIATAPTVAAIEASIVGPNHQVAVLALVAASSLGAAMLGFAFLRRLLSLGGVALLSRINSKDIMKNETRASVFEIVKSDPGVSLNEIVDRLGVSRNAVAYHLAVFESEDQIVSVKDGKYRRYFVNGGKFVNGAKHVVSALKNNTTRQVIEFIQRHPGAIQKDVCAAVGTSPSATNWHINRLEKVGLVDKEKVANTVQYRPGPSFDKYDLDEFGLAYA